MKAKFTVVYGPAVEPGEEAAPLGSAEFPYSVEAFEADAADYALQKGTPRFTGVKLDAMRYWGDKVSAVERFNVVMNLVWL